MKKFLAGILIAGLMSISTCVSVFAIDNWQDFGLAGDTERLSDLLTVRSSAILTTDWVAGTVVDVSKAGQLEINVDFTIGSLTEMQLKIETSNTSDGTFYTEIVEVISATGEAAVVSKYWTFDASGNYKLRYPVNAKYVKVSVKGVGTVTSSLCAINVRTGWGN